jgi:hypothetical protein
MDVDALGVGGVIISGLVDGAGKYSGDACESFEGAGKAVAGGICWVEFCIGALRVMGGWTDSAEDAQVVAKSGSVGADVGSRAITSQDPSEAMGIISEVCCGADGTYRLLV